MDWKGNEMPGCVAGKRRLFGWKVQEGFSEEAQWSLRLSEEEGSTKSRSRGNWALGRDSENKNNYLVIMNSTDFSIEHTGDILFPHLPHEIYIMADEKVTFEKEVKERTKEIPRKARLCCSDKYPPESLWFNNECFSCSHYLSSAGWQRERRELCST